MIIRLPATLALAVLLTVTAAHARDALDRDTVSRWIAAAQDLQGWAEARDTDDADDELLDGPAVPAFADIENVYREMFDADAEVRSVVRRHGFHSAQQWGDVSARITLGLLSLEMGEQQPQMTAEMQQAIRELESSPDVPPQMREMLMQQMQQAMGALNALTEGVREEDLPVLREMRTELRAVIDVGDDEVAAW